MILLIHTDSLSISLVETVPEKYISLTRTKKELSVISRTEDVGDAMKVEHDWSAMSIDTQTGLDFSELGIIAKITSILATAGISVFVMSTYLTDYILIKSTSLESAKSALAGQYEIREGGAI